MSRTRLALIVACLSGALVAVQTRINAALAVDLGDALLAAVVSFAVGLVAVVLVVAARPPARAALPVLRQVPWWSFLGGFGGATLVAVAAFSAPRLGVALLTVGIVAGQTAGGLLVDRLGLGPGGAHALTAPRIVGVLVCLVAVGVSVAGRGAGEANPLLLLLAVLAGLLISLQQALNGRVRRITGDAAVATLVNFVVGLSALLVAYAVIGFSRGWSVQAWPDAAHWWLYSGGPLGATFVAVAAVVVRTLGVLRLGLAVIAGQLVGAVALDITFPAAAQGVALATLVGVGLTFVAVAITGRAVRGPA
ncbi:MAG: DMT family transporter [Mycobacteriales bacterium]